MKARRLILGAFVLGLVGAVSLGARGAKRETDLAPVSVQMALTDGPRDPALEDLLARHRAVAVDPVAANR